MHILTLELENIKSYTNSRIDFAEGINAIVGQNGAGKSTILEAIGFVLFDALDYSQSEFVREGAKQASITVTFVSSADERPYQAFRRIGSSPAQTIFDPETGLRVCSGKVDFTAFLRQHLAVDPGTDLTRLFRDAVGVPQGTLTAAFLLTPEKRKTIFDPLLKVEDYKVAFEKLLEARSLLKERQNQLNVAIATLTGELLQLPASEQAAQRIANEIVKAEDDLQTATAQLAVLRNELQTLETARQAVAAVDARKAKADQALTGAEAQLRTAERALAEAEAARNRVTVSQAAHDRYVAAQAKKTELDSQQRQRQELQLQAAAAQRDLALAQNRAEQAQKELAAIAAAEAAVVRLAPAVLQQAELEAVLSTAREQQTRLQTAQRDAAQQRRTLEQAQQQLTLLTGQLAKATQLQQTQVDTQAQLGQQQALLASLREEGGRQKAEGEALKKQSDQLQQIDTAICPLCEGPLTAGHRADMLARNSRRRDELRLALQAVLQQQKNAEAEAQRLEQTLVKLQAEMMKLARAQEVATQEATIAGITRALTEVDAQIAALANAPTLVKEVEAQLAALGNPKQESALASAQSLRRSQVEAALSTAQRQQNDYTQQHTALNAKLTEFDGLEPALALVDAELRETLTAYQTVLSNRQLAASVTQRQAEVQQRSAALSAAQTQTMELQVELANAQAGFDPAHHQRTVKLEQQAGAQVGGVTAQLKLLRAEEERTRATIARLQEQRRQMQSAQARLAQVESQDRTLDVLRNAIKQAGPYITRALITQIAETAAQIFGELMQDYMRRLQWNEDYGITLDVDGMERQFAQLSGGEQMAAALSVRLALLREMSGINVAFFDEPTSNLDETRRDALAQQIRNVKGFSQLFVISHDDTFEQMTDRLIRVTRVNGVSQVSYS